MGRQLGTVFSESAPVALPGSPTLSGLVASTGESWRSFRATLVPRYTVVWREIATCHALIIIGLASPAVAARALGAGAVLWATPAAAVWIGYWISSLMSFMHEAAHFNLHPNKTVNDRLANWLICPLAAEDVRHYRALHWQHHLHLGSPDDTEVSYHRAPTPWFLFEAAIGIHTLRVLFRKLAHQSGSAQRDLDSSGRIGLLRGVLVHGAIVALPVLTGAYEVAAAWSLGAVLGYPFWTALRQVLEHRAADAPAGVDFMQVAHGPVNRMFGSDLFSRTFGAAGFNRHLLHHWYPLASYTCFDDLEAFFMRTSLAPAMDAARASYWGTLRQLMHPAARLPRQ